MQGKKKHLKKMPSLERLLAAEAMIVPNLFRYNRIIIAEMDGTPRLRLRMDRIKLG